ncbi:hypothetical protein GCM10009744_56840 [Kribbella alba]|uniref:Uncharacterized protein n=1 Tax=Kribbella alba TaxID=190197 RepID=A0ABN2FQI7_9ACTN
MDRQNMAQQKPRLFLLVRHTHVSGLRGTGTLAEGVEWSDGAVTLRWRGRSGKTSVWDGGVDALLAAHGRGGRTQVHWIAAAPSSIAATARTRAAGGPAPRAGSIQGAVGGVWIPAPGADGLCRRCGRVWPCLACGP